MERRVAVLQWERNGHSPSSILIDFNSYFPGGRDDNGHGNQCLGRPLLEQCIAVLSAAMHSAKQGSGRVRERMNDSESIGSHRKENSETIGCNRQKAIKGHTLLPLYLCIAPTLL